MNFILACDLGSTSSRAGLVDEDGDIRFMASGRGPAIEESGNRSETDVSAWWTSFAAMIDELGETAGDAFGRVRAVAISGITRTQILVGADGMPLRPAMTWADRRASEEAEAIVRLLPAGHPEGRHVNSFHPAARLSWLARHEPSTLAALAAVLDPKDHFNARLTGRRTTDAVSSARLIASAAQPGGEPSILARLGLPSGIVPEIVVPGTVIGPVVAGLPGALGRLAGLPVLAMAHDTWASVLGLGALRDGFAYNLSGTTEVLGVLSGRVAEAEGLMSVTWAEGVHQLGGPSQSGADTLVWALELVGRRTPGRPVGGDVDDLLARPREAQPLVFLPFLQGERTPYWDPDLRGSFIGLNRRHTAVDCAFAVLEGIAMLNRVVLTRAEAAIGSRVGEIRFGGGGAANPAWCQIKADVCERPVVVTRCAEPGLLGAAIVGWAALGRDPSLAAGQERLVRVARRHAPRTAKAAAYRALFDLFERSEAALRPISRALARWPAGGGEDGT